MSTDVRLDSAELARIRADFPLLTQADESGSGFVYLDSAATAQKPDPVLDAEQDFYIMRNAAVHRGAHSLSTEATEAFEEARGHVARLVGADVDELVWTSGATAGLNLLAYAFSNATVGRGPAGADRFALRPGDQIVVSEAEHHANLVPWQELAARTGAELRWFGVGDGGRIVFDPDVITARTKIVAVTHVSNVTGAITDVAPIVARAHEVGALVVLDACQSVPHMPVDFHGLDVDFAAFSAHKMYAPTGIGALYGKRELLADLPPVTTGGSMVEVVTMTEATYVPAPLRFEAGTQPVAQAVAFGVAAQYLHEIGMDKVAAHEAELAALLLDAVQLPGVRVIGPTDLEDRIAVVSFVVDGVHAHDVGQVLDDRGIAVRVGHHCAQPIHRRFSVAATTRASAGIYTTSNDIAALGESLASVREFFGLGADHV